MVKLVFFNFFFLQQAIV